MHYLFGHSILINRKVLYDSNYHREGELECCRCRLFGKLLKNLHFKFSVFYGENNLLGSGSKRVNAKNYFINKINEEVISLFPNIV